MATLEKIEKDIIRTKAKISEYQQKLRPAYRTFKRVCKG